MQVTNVSKYQSTSFVNPPRKGLCIASEGFVKHPNKGLQEAIYIGQQISVSGINSSLCKRRFYDIVTSCSTPPFKYPTCLLLTEDSPVTSQSVLCDYHAVWRKGITFYLRKIHNRAIIGYLISTTWHECCSTRIYKNMSTFVHRKKISTNLSKLMRNLASPCANSYKPCLLNWKPQMLALLQIVKLLPERTRDGNINLEPS